MRVTLIIHPAVHLKLRSFLYYFDYNVYSKEKIVLFSFCFHCGLETPQDNDFIVVLIFFRKLIFSFSRK